MYVSRNDVKFIQNSKIWSIWHLMQFDFKLIENELFRIQTEAFISVSNVSLTISYLYTWRMLNLFNEKSSISKGFCRSNRVMTMAMIMGNVCVHNVCALRMFLCAEMVKNQVKLWLDKRCNSSIWSTLVFRQNHFLLYNLLIRNHLYPISNTIYLFHC